REIRQGRLIGPRNRERRERDSEAEQQCAAHRATDYTGLARNAVRKGNRLIWRGSLPILCKWIRPSGAASTLPSLRWPSLPRLPPCWRSGSGLEDRGAVTAATDIRPNGPSSQISTDRFSIAAVSTGAVTAKRAAAAGTPTIRAPTTISRSG